MKCLIIHSQYKSTHRNLHGFLMSSPPPWTLNKPTNNTTHHNTTPHLFSKPSPIKQQPTVKKEMEKSGQKPSINPNY